MACDRIAAAPRFENYEEGNPYEIRNTVSDAVMEQTSVSFVGA